MEIAGASLSTAAADAPVMVLRQAMNADAAEAQALLQVLPPPPKVGRLVDVYA
jgi:hypothetical protein